MSWFFGFFFVSGFCSILYEVIWLRLSMAEFGVTTALVSIVVSMFMAGLGLGSLGSGYLIKKYQQNRAIPAIRLYALTELLIGISAILVPYELSWCRHLLEYLGLASSGAYYVASGICIALIVIPWCACMGATIPLGMLAIRQYFNKKSQKSFSYLYLANVLGAVAGATIPLFLIELLGFVGALRIGAFLNFILALLAVTFKLGRESSLLVMSVNVNHSQQSSSGKILFLLFLTGLTSMGMEIVWIRQLTPYLSTVVYSFAAILAIYLAATFSGSWLYRYWNFKESKREQFIWVFLGVSALFPLVLTDPSFSFTNFQRLLWGIGPFSMILGYVTPMLVDKWSGGDADKAGRAYAVNILGCILGPLLSGFILLPLFSEHWVLVIFSLPWFIMSGIAFKAQHGIKLGWQNQFSYLGLLFLAVVLVWKTRGYEDQFEQRIVMRDHTATLIATGDGMNKRLLVNGVGITMLTPITKMMAHLPLAFLGHAPRNALVVCFGMGTTYRSLLSWNIFATAVELVPNVPKLFTYYHPDGQKLLNSARSHVVIDDGRRYLERTSEKYDVITIDPPPPMEAAGSSMLFSKEFYSIVKKRLQDGGIFQQWLISLDPLTQSAATRALMESFPYVRVFKSVEGWGLHFLASNRPIPNLTPQQLVEHMPKSALVDMMEWGPKKNEIAQLAGVLNSEFSPVRLLQQSSKAPALQDDRPINEYYLLRRQVF